jgi:hypothetical protein
VDVLLDEYAKGYRLNHRPKSVTLVEGRAADLKRLTANPLPTHLIEARGRVNWKSGAIVGRASDAEEERGLLEAAPRNTSRPIYP